MSEIILCYADAEHYCRDCAIDKRLCNYPSDDTRACDEYEEKQLEEQK